MAEIKEGVALGVVDGVTTNPSLIAKEKRPFRPLVEEICAAVPGDVSLEVVATDFEGMVKEGEELRQIADNVVVKCPLTKDGLKAVKYLSGKGIRVNQTLCFSAPQAEAITQLIDCAIGMNEAIGDQAAITFAAAFYRAVGFGRSVKTARQSSGEQVSSTGAASGRSIT